MDSVYGLLDLALLYCYFNVILYRSTLPVDSVFGLLDLALLWQSVLCGLLVHISWSLTTLLIKVYITEVRMTPYRKLGDFLF